MQKYSVIPSRTCKALQRSVSWCILFDGRGIGFDVGHHVLKEFPNTSVKNQSHREQISLHTEFFVDFLGELDL